MTLEDAKEVLQKGSMGLVIGGKRDHEWSFNHIPEMDISNRSFSDSHTLKFRAF